MVGDVFRKSSQVPTPLAIKLGAGFAGFLYLSALLAFVPRAGHLAVPLGLDTAEGLVAAVVGLAFAVAYWNLKRWAVVGLFALALLNIVSVAAISSYPGRTLLVIGAMRLVPLAPGFLYWPLMTSR